MVLQQVFVDVHIHNFLVADMKEGCLCVKFYLRVSAIVLKTQDTKPGITFTT